MRKELEKIELIEQFLMNELNTEETLAFSSRMEANMEMKSDVLLQSSLVDRIELLAFKDEVASFRKTGGSNYRKIFAVLALVIALGFGTWMIMDNSNDQTATTTTIESSSSSEFIDYNEFEDGDVQMPLAIDEDVKIEAKNGLNFQDFQVPFVTKKINPEVENVISFTKSNSTFTIPANSIILDNGSLAKGLVDLKFREFRNSAEIAFSGIPMDYQDGALESAGMFEIRAFQNGKELSLANNQEISVDYEVVEQIPNLKFYELENDTKWKELRSLDAVEPEIMELQEDALVVETKIFTVVENMPTFGNCDPPSDNCAMQQLLDYTSGVNYPQEAIDRDIEGKVFVRFIVEKDGTITDVTIARGVHPLIDNAAALRIAGMPKWNPGTQRGQNVAVQFVVPITFMIDGPVNDKKKNNQEFDFSNVIDSELIYPLNPRQEYIDTVTQVVYTSVSNETGDYLFSSRINNTNQSNINPNLMLGLSMSGFGIFNCDAYYLFNNRVTFKPKFVDFANNSIADAWYISVVNLDRRGAFIFSQNSITIDKYSNSIILFYTQKGQLYASNNKAIKNLELKGNQHTFQMENISDQVTDTKELKKYLLSQK